MEFLEVYIYCVSILIAVVIGVDIYEKFNDRKGRKKIMSGFIFEGAHVSEEQILKAATEIMAKNLDDDKDVCDGLACEDCAFRNKKYCLSFCIFYDRGEE